VAYERSRGVALPGNPPAMRRSLLIVVDGTP
jgi:hypothetical protein